MRENILIIEDDKDISEILRFALIKEGYNVKVNPNGLETEEEIKVCGLIGLFHDIGAFSNKFKNVLTLEDNTDKSKESIEILFETDKLLRSITEDKK